MLKTVRKSTGANMQEPQARVSLGRPPEQLQERAAREGGPGAQACCKMPVKFPKE